MLHLVQLLFVAALSMCSQARRYRTCEEGCCVHEYCAYHRICYPRIHCSLGCPDGQCVGQDQKNSEPIPQPKIFRRHHNLSPTENKNNLEMSSSNEVFLERYSYQDQPRKDTLSSRTESSVKGNEDDAGILSDKGDHSNESRSAKQNVPVTDGICMPYKPCKQNEFCGLGHICTFNYNLGYNVCQYNLDIGSTLCYDSKGRPILQSIS